MTAELIGLVPPGVIRDLVNGRWLPLIGAGFSKNASVPHGAMPSWVEPGDRLAQDLAQFVSSSPLDAISAFEHEYGRTKLIERLHAELHIGDATPGTAHNAFVGIPFDLVATTNFDPLLEHAYATAGTPCLPLVDEEQLALENPYPGPRLFKIHGDIHRPSSLVLTERDYDEYARRRPLLTTFLASLLISRTLILVGYSLDDPDLRQVIGLVRERLGPMRQPVYAISVARGTIRGGAV